MFAIKVFIVCLILKSFIKKDNSVGECEKSFHFDAIEEIFVITLNFKVRSVWQRKSNI